MKYEIQAFRAGEVDGVALTGGDVLARVETEIPFPTLQRALANGLAEPVKIKEAPALVEGGDDSQPELPPK